MNIIDTKSYLDVLCELTRQGKSVTTVVTGGSMEPFLVSNKDSVKLEQPPEKLRKGDIVLYKRKNGDYVLHRIRFIRNEGYYLVGDRQYAVEGPLPREAIQAIATDATHKGKWIGNKSFRWRFFAVVWLYAMPLRAPIYSVAHLVKGRKRSKKNPAQ